MPRLVRQLRVDLDQAFDLHWLGGKAFASQLFNALSMAFPAGEQFFIDGLRAGAKTLSAAQQAQWAATMNAFVGQEATHRHLHTKFNRHLAGHGLVNRWQARVMARNAKRAKMAARHQVAMVAAYEHITAVLAQGLLLQPHWLQGAPERLRLLWQWHSAEEVEHRAVAYDLCCELRVSYGWRCLWFGVVLFEFSSDMLRQTVNNLARSGQLWRWATWRDAAHLMLGQRGVVPTSLAPLLAWFKPSFHPNQAGHADLSKQWLLAHSSNYRILGPTPKHAADKSAAQALGTPVAPCRTRADHELATLP
jgi:uncharacterized protein